MGSSETLGSGFYRYRVLLYLDGRLFRGGLGFDVALDEIFEAIRQEAKAGDDVWNCPANCFTDGNSNDEDVLGKVIRCLR